MTIEIIQDDPDLVFPHRVTGWRDQLGEINVRGTGSSDPAYSQVGATNFYAFLFPGTGVQLKQFWHQSHIQHDFKLGSKVYPHVHWIPATSGTGNVVWNVSWTAAKGHGQGAFDFANPTTFQIIQAAPGVAYQHMIAEASEAQAVSISGMEPDTVICWRVWRDPADAGDTYAADVFSNFFDIHYEVDRVATVGRSPNFYDR
jgi:hypothetical protein